MVIRRMAFLLAALAAGSLAAESSYADGLTEKLIQLGAGRARDCLKIGVANGPSKVDHMHGYADCLSNTVTPIQYSSENEKAVDSGIYIAGRYILKREFGEIDQKTYGIKGQLEFKEIDTSYRWALGYLKGRGMEKSAACAAIGWVDCKLLP